MRALVLKQPGTPPSLSVMELPDPVPGPGQALVKVVACGFCHHDLLVMNGVLRRGVKPDLVLGHEVAGTVVEIGDGVTTVQTGDSVVALLTDSCGQCDRCRQGREHRCRHGKGIGHGRDGGFAEYLVVSQHSLVVLPEGIDLASASILACPIGVALNAVQQVAQVRQGETVVVTGAGGGLGVHAVQISAALGGRVLAVTSSPDKASHLSQHGASEVLESGPLDFSELVFAMTEDQGADVVIDTVGSVLYPSTWRCLAQYGRLVLLGEVAGGPASLDLAEIIFRDARVLGSSGVSRAVVHQAVDLVAQGTLKPVVSQILSLEQAATACQLLSDREVLGRVLLRPT